MQVQFSNPIIHLSDLELEFVADIDWFDGTRLGLLRDQDSNRLWVMRWVGFNDQTNIWLFFPVTPRSLSLYTKEKLTDADFMLLNVIDTVQVVEMNGDYAVNNKTIRPVAEIMDSAYRPSSKCYFNPEDCPDLALVNQILTNYPLNEVEVHSTANLFP